MKNTNNNKNKTSKKKNKKSKSKKTKRKKKYKKNAKNNIDKKTKKNKKIIQRHRPVVVRPSSWAQSTALDDMSRWPPSWRRHGPSLRCPV